MIRSGELFDGLRAARDHRPSPAHVASALLGLGLVAAPSVDGDLTGTALELTAAGARWLTRAPNRSRNLRLVRPSGGGLA